MRSIDFIAITSIHLPHLQLMLGPRATPTRNTSSPPPNNFLLNHRLPIQLHAYYEGLGTPPAMNNVTWKDIKKLQPWAVAYAQKELVGNSTIQTAYAEARLRCVVGGSGVGYYTVNGVCKDVLTVYKVAALLDACVTRPASQYVVWVDSDCYFNKALDERFWAFASRFDFATIFRRGEGDPDRSPNTPETGIISLRAGSPATARLLHDTKRGFYDEDAYLAATSVNDVSLFNRALRTSDPLESGLQVGRFAVGCRNEGIKAITEAGNREWEMTAYMNRYENSMHRVDCPETSLPAISSTVSPFNVFEYITHAKGFGPMGKGGMGLSPHNAPGVYGTGDRRTGWRTRLYGYNNTLLGRLRASSNATAAYASAFTAISAKSQGRPPCASITAIAIDGKVRTKERNVEGCESRCLNMPRCAGLSVHTMQGVKGYICALYYSCENGVDIVPEGRCKPAKYGSGSRCYEVLRGRALLPRVQVNSGDQLSPPRID